MDNEKLKRVFKAFSASGTFVSAQLLHAGRINETYHLTANEEAEYILQCVRSGIFSNIPEMIRNKELVSGHIRNKLIKQRIHDITRKYITYFHTYRGQPYYKDYEGNYWTLSLYINGAKNYNKVSSPQMAYEIGLGLGEFEKRVSDFDPQMLKETIPSYQNPQTWKERLLESLENATPEKREKSGEAVSYLQAMDNEVVKLQQMREEEQFPLRVTLNSFKSGSILLDWNDKALCVQDLDLVMPGILHYDFGDAACSVCNPEGNNARNPEEVRFEMEFFKEFLSGFMGKVQRLLSRKERDTLFLSCLLMPYLHASRSLVSYLKEDHHLPGSTSEEELNKANTQIRLLRSIVKQSKMIRHCLEQ